MSASAQVLVTGASGLVGRALLEQWPDAYVTSRDPSRASNKLAIATDRVIRWNPIAEPLRLPVGFQPRCVVNLMGEPVLEGRWTEEKKSRIRDSRVLGTRNLVTGLIDAGCAPEVLVSASAVGYYGDRGDEQLVESSPPGDGFLADICRDWEAAAHSLANHGSRVVCLRIGVVLASQGGALAPLRPIFRWGLGGPLGRGKQWFPWVHLDDLVDLIVWLRDKPQLDGAINGTAPEPVRNRDFTRALARRLKRPAFLPVPRWGASIVLGESAQILFASQRVLPQRALEAGFRFRYPTLDIALHNLMP